MPLFGHLALKLQRIWSNKGTGVRKSLIKLDNSKNSGTTVLIVSSSFGFRCNF
jgi:hypothetical protein